MDLTATIAINRPAADVFDYVMEVPHDAQWRIGRRQNLAGVQRLKALLEHTA